jgi:hypothetical protein
MLFRELCSADFAQLSASFQNAAAIPDALERLHACGMLYIQFAVEHPNQYRLMFMTPHPPGATDEALACKGDPNEDAYAFLSAIVEAGMSEAPMDAAKADLALGPRPPRLAAWNQCRTK